VRCCAWLLLVRWGRRVGDLIWIVYRKKKRFVLRLWGERAFQTYADFAFMRTIHKFNRSVRLQNLPVTLAGTFTCRQICQTVPRYLYTRPVQHDPNNSRIHTLAQHPPVHHISPFHAGPTFPSVLNLNYLHLPSSKVGGRSPSSRLPSHVAGPTR
jgi:hypothetical protein